MNRLPPLPVEKATALLNELRGLMAEPMSVVASLHRRGYTTKPYRDGVLAMVPGSTPDTLIVVPLNEAAACSISGLFASGANVARCGAVLAAMRAAEVVAPIQAAALLFTPAPVTTTHDLPGTTILALEGGVSPRIWPSCFGSVDFLIRCLGRQPQRDLPNVAVNALEAAIPILSGLQAAAAFPAGQRRNSGSPDAPLTPRLSLLAAHGGTRGAAPPTLFDIVATRRYSPDESIDTVTAEIEAVVRGAAAANLRVEVSVLGHTAPVEDPTRPQWSPEAAALAIGWRWPQTSFRTRPPVVANSVLFGGLEDAGVDPSLPTAFISVEEIEALARSLVIYLSTS